MNAYTRQCIQQVLPLRMQPKQNMPISRKDDNLSDNFRPHVDKKSVLEGPEIEADNIDLIGKSLDTGSHAKDMLSRRTP